MRKALLSLKIPVSIFKEDKHFIAYTPALDLSTSGDSFKEVKNRFEEAVYIFFDEVSKRGTLEEVLQELGWKKLKKTWSPPRFISHETEEIKVPV